MKKERPLLVYPNTDIFIACPAGLCTGGPELLHQLCDALRDKGYQAFMFYVGDGDHSCPAQYRVYDAPTIDSVVDDYRNVLIAPEAHTDALWGYSRIRKAIWWLSVDNYQLYQERGIKSAIKSIFPRVSRGRPYFRFGFYYRKVTHIVQSHYASLYIQSRTGRIPLYLSDYLNEVFFADTERVCDPKLKRDIVLYNPKKGFHTTSLIIAAAPDIEWRELSGLTPIEVRELLSHAKVYIDFGNHPGKDRIPREAAIQGCCLITGKRGSSALAEDVPIPDTYKFGENAPVDMIAERIRYVLAHYQECARDFQSYRERIRGEKQSFIADVERVFVAVMEPGRR